MKQPTILFVEDNPIARKMVRVALEGEGYTVLEADTGRAALELMSRHAPDLVLQDLVLPDMDGFDLVGQFRALPAGRDVPILAFSGFLSKMEQARSQQVGFTDYLFKPVEPSRLIETIRTHLQLKLAGAEQTGQGRRILLAHDDPSQIKRLRFHLEEAGYQVSTADNGIDALEQARRSPPDAIVSDALMPGLDGFRLCQAIRRDPALARVPVVLTSAAFAEEEDRRLAQAAGASALLLQNSDGRDLIEAVEASMKEPPPPASEQSELTGDYEHRLIRHLERQASLNASLAERLALREAELAILAGVAETLQSSPSEEAVLGELLNCCLNAAGISKGAAWLFVPEGKLALRAQLGFPAALRGELGEFFGHAGLLRKATESGEPVAIPSAENPGEDLLSRAGATSLLIVPLVAGDVHQGVMAMVSEHRDLGQDWLSFAKVVGHQVSQAVALAGAFSRLRENEGKLAGIVSAMADGLLISDRNGRFVFCNAAAEHILGLAADRIVGRKCTDPAWAISRLDGTPIFADQHPCIQVMNTGQSVYEVELRTEAPDGRLMIVSVNCAPMREASGELIGAVTTLHDVTRRIQTEQTLARQAERLARANTELEQFNYAASHDLQEPLRTVASYLQLLERRYKGKLDAEADRFIGFAVDAARRMQRLIADLLAFSRLTRAQNNFQPVDCGALFRQSVANLQAAIEESRAAVTQDRLPKLVADAMQLSQLFQNLIGNGIKFHGEAPPQVHVSTQRTGQEWVFSIRDNGIGIEPQYSERIFQVFQRLHGKQAYPGSGIGLALCKRIVENHGGRIWVESEPGQGATFYFTLPAEIAPTPARPSSQDPVAVW